MSSVDWGNVPAWLGAVFTPASVLVAYRALRRANQQDERQHAARVYLLTANASEMVDGALVVEVAIENKSDGPIYKPAAMTVIETPSGHIRSGVGHGYRDRDIVLPGGRWSIRYLEAATEPYLFAMAGLIFTDALGTTWYRFSDGQLVKAATPPLFQSAHMAVRRFRRTHVKSPPFKSYEVSPRRFIQIETGEPDKRMTGRRRSTN